MRHLRFLAALAAVLGLVVAREAGSPPSFRPIPVAGRPATAPTSGTVVPLPGDLAAAALVAAILERPLFAPGRRPPAGGGASKAGAVRLAGTVVAGGRGRVAILAVPGRDRPLVLREGEAGLGLSIVTIAPGEVVALDHANRVVLTLHAVDRSGVAGVHAAAAPDMTKDPRIRGPNNQDE